LGELQKHNYLFNIIKMGLRVIRQVYEPADRNVIWGKVDPITGDVVFHAFEPNGWMPTTYNSGGGGGGGPELDPRWLADKPNYLTKTEASGLIEASVDEFIEDLTDTGVIASKTYVDQEILDLNAAAVHKTGNETIAGVKTFSTLPVLPATNPSGQQAVSASYLTATLNGRMNTVYNKTEIDALLDAVDVDPSTLYQIVPSLASVTTPVQNRIYIVPISSTEAQTNFWDGDSWVLMGSFQDIPTIDLTPYYTKTQTDALLVPYITEAEVDEALDDYVDLASNQTITGNKVFGTLPTLNSQATTDYQATNKMYVDDAIEAAVATLATSDFSPITGVGSDFAVKIAEAIIAANYPNTFRFRAPADMSNTPTGEDVTITGSLVMSTTRDYYSGIVTDRSGKAWTLAVTGVSGTPACTWAPVNTNATTIDISNKSDKYTITEPSITKNLTDVLVGEDMSYVKLMFDESFSFIGDSDPIGDMDRKIVVFEDNTWIGIISDGYNQPDLPIYGYWRADNTEIAEWNVEGTWTLSNGSYTLPGNLIVKEVIQDIGEVTGVAGVTTYQSNAQNLSVDVEWLYKNTDRKGRVGTLSSSDITAMNAQLARSMAVNANIISEAEALQVINMLSDILEGPEITSLTGAVDAIQEALLAIVPGLTEEEVQLLINDALSGISDTAIMTPNYNKREIVIANDPVNTFFPAGVVGSTTYIDGTNYTILNDGFIVITGNAASSGQINSVVLYIDNTTVSATRASAVNNVNAIDYNFTLIPVKKDSVVRLRINAPSGVTITEGSNGRIYYFPPRLGTAMDLALANFETIQNATSEYARLEGLIAGKLQTQSIADIKADFAATVNASTLVAADKTTAITNFNTQLDAMTDPTVTDISTLISLVLSEFGLDEEAIQDMIDASMANSGGFSVPDYGNITVIANNSILPTFFPSGAITNSLSGAEYTMTKDGYITVVGYVNSSKTPLSGNSFVFRVYINNKIVGFSLGGTDQSGNVDAPNGLYPVKTGDVIYVSIQVDGQTGIVLTKNATLYFLPPLISGTASDPQLANFVTKTELEQYLNSSGSIPDYSAGIKTLASYTNNPTVFPVGTITASVYKNGTTVIAPDDGFIYGNYKISTTVPAATITFRLYINGNSAYYARSNDLEDVSFSFPLTYVKKDDEIYISTTSSQNATFALPTGNIWYYPAVPSIGSTGDYVTRTELTAATDAISNMLSGNLNVATIKSDFASTVNASTLSSTDKTAAITDFNTRLDAAATPITVTDVSTIISLVLSEFGLTEAEITAIVNEAISNQNLVAAPDYSKLFTVFNNVNIPTWFPTGAIGGTSIIGTGYTMLNDGNLYISGSFDLASKSASETEIRHTLYVNDKAIASDIQRIDTVDQSYYFTFYGIYVSAGDVIKLRLNTGYTQMPNISTCDGTVYLIPQKQATVAPDAELAQFATLSMLGDHNVWDTDSHSVIAEDLMDHRMGDRERWAAINIEIQELKAIVADQQATIDALKDAAADWDPAPVYTPVLDFSQTTSIPLTPETYTVSNQYGGQMAFTVPVPAIGLLGIQIGSGGTVWVNGNIVLDTTDVGVLDLLPADGDSIVLDLHPGDVITWDNAKTITFTPRV
jgi:hypothetical protein